MKRAVLLALVIVLVAVLGAYLDWRGEHRRTAVVKNTPRGPHVTTAAEIQGGPLTPQRKRIFTALVCGRPSITNDKGEIGCPVCPAGSDFATPELQGNDAGGVVPEPLPDAGWTFGSMIFGHFTAADADEALLKTNGCESHARNFGGDFLLRKVDGQWTSVRYIQGGLADEGCQRLGWEGGRAALLCHTSDMQGGMATETAMLMTVEPTPPDGSQSGESAWLLLVGDDEGDCTGEQELRTTQNASIERISLVPGQNGRQDVEVQASIGRVKAKPVNDQCPVAVKLPYKLRFRNDGDHLTAVDGLPALRGLQADDCCEVRASEVVRPYRM